MANCRFVIKFSIAFALLGGAAHAQSNQCEPDKIKDKYPEYAGKVVKIGATPIAPPFAYADPKNPDGMVGIEIEMIEKAMACAGLKHEYVRGPWSSLLSALLSGSGSMDVMISNVNYRADRAQRADYVVYMRVGESIIVPKGNPRKLGDVGSLCGFTGSSTVGGASAVIIERQSKLCEGAGRAAITYVPAVDAESAYRQLSNARVDFVMDDGVQASARVTRQPELEIAHAVTTDARSGMVVKKGNAEMLRILADGLRVQEKNGSILTIAKKYNFPLEQLIPIETLN